VSALGPLAAQSAMKGVSPLSPFRLLMPACSAKNSCALCDLIDKEIIRKLSCHLVYKDGKILRQKFLVARWGQLGWYPNCTKSLARLSGESVLGEKRGRTNWSADAVIGALAADQARAPDIALRLMIGERDLERRVDRLGVKSKIKRDSRLRQCVRNGRRRPVLIWPLARCRRERRGSSPPGSRADRVSAAASRRDRDGRGGSRRCRCSRR